MSSLRVFTKTIDVITQQFNTNERVVVENIKLNNRLYEKYPAIFDYGYYMEAPVCLINGYTYTAKSGMLQTKFNDFDVNDKFQTDQVIEELVNYIRDLKSQNYTYIPYIPLMTISCIDPENLVQSTIFKSRYDILENPQL